MPRNISATKRPCSGHCLSQVTTRSPDSSRSSRIRNTRGAFYPPTAQKARRCSQCALLAPSGCKPTKLERRSINAFLCAAMPIHFFLWIRLSCYSLNSCRFCPPCLPRVVCGCQFWTIFNWKIKQLPHSVSLFIDSFSISRPEAGETKTLQDGDPVSHHACKSTTIHALPGFHS